MWGSSPVSSAPLETVVHDEAAHAGGAEARRNAAAPPRSAAVEGVADTRSRC
jgi:hypothetical protein